MSQLNIGRLLLLTPLAFVAATVFHSLELVGAVVAADVTIELIVLVLYADAKLKVPAHRVFGSLRIPVAAGLVAAAAVLGAHQALLSFDQALRLAIEVVIGVAAYVATVVLLDRSALHELLRLARTATARSPSGAPSG
jgi:hypothetical protein